jgi:hypothetical protein
VLPKLQLPDAPRASADAGPPKASIGRVAAVTLVILALLAALAWWLMRS